MHGSKESTEHEQLNHPATSRRKI